jgi:hypothetical protein
MENGPKSRCRPTRTVHVAWPGPVTEPDRPDLARPTPRRGGPWSRRPCTCWARTTLLGVARQQQIHNKVLMEAPPRLWRTGTVRWWPWKRTEEEGWHRGRSSPAQRQRGDSLASKAKLRGVGVHLRGTMVLRDLQGGMEGQWVALPVESGGGEHRGAQQWTYWRWTRGCRAQTKCMRMGPFYSRARGGKMGHARSCTWVRCDAATKLGVLGWSALQAQWGATKPCATWRAREGEILSVHRRRVLS